MIIIDLKHYSEKKYVQFTGVSNHSILENLDFAVAIGKTVAVRITITPASTTRSSMPAGMPTFCLSTTSDM